MNPQELSTSTQDYLKTIWHAGEWALETVTTTSLASRMGLAASTVSEALKKLTAQGMVRRPSYGVVELTEEGRAVAVQMVRRHRILEMFLVTELGYAWDEVHDEAEVLEHAVTDRFIDALDARLGHPAKDPHGDVIPAADGTMRAPVAVQLGDIAVGQVVVVVRVSDESPSLLRHLADVDVVPGAEIRVLEPADHDDPGSVSVAVLSTGDAVNLSVLDAEAVWVS